MNETSDAWSQYRCGRVVWGMQTPSIPSPTPRSLTSKENHNYSLKDARFDTFRNHATIIGLNEAVF